MMRRISKDLDGRSASADGLDESLVHRDVENGLAGAEFAGGSGGDRWGAVLARIEDEAGRSGPRVAVASPFDDDDILEGPRRWLGRNARSAGVLAIACAVGLLPSDYKLSLPPFRDPKARANR